MISKTISFTLLMLVLGIACPLSKAQDTNNASKPSSQPAVINVPSKKIEANTFRFEFTINEFENGKKLNSRKYSLDMVDQEPGQDLNIGTRVPVPSEDGKSSYLDIGTRLFARLVNYHSPLTLDVRVDLSTLANPADVAKNVPPLVRQVRISASTAVILNKTMVIGSVEDPNSDHQFQLEVTATKL